MRGSRQFPLAIISGILLALSFPLPGIQWMAWIAAAPLIAASLESGPRRAFALGCAAGAVWTSGTLYWTYIYHALALFFTVAVLSLYTGIFSLLLNLTARGRPREMLVLLVPLAWTSVEFVKSAGYLGFPWNSLGYSQHMNLPLIQVAEYTGVFGVSFAVSAVNGGAAAAFFLRKTPRRAALCLFSSLLLPAILTLSGIITIRTLPRGAGEARIAALQTSVHPEISWGEFGRVVADSFSSLSGEAAVEEPFLTVLPETAVPEDLSCAFRERTWLYASFAGMASRGGWMLTGAHYTEGDALYNSAYLVSPEGEIAGRYDKMKLVPGGEYLPVLSRAAPVRKVLGGAGGYTPGSERKVFEIGDESFAALICFEGIFGGHARRFVRGGAGFLINITNDAWSMSRASHYQHASMASMRSVENRVWTVRAGNTGITRFINPAGEIEAELPYWKRGYLVHDVAARPARSTFYTRYGDAFGVSVTAAFLLIAALSLPGARKRPPAGHGRS